MLRTLASLVLASVVCAVSVAPARADTAGSVQGTVTVDGTPRGGAVVVASGNGAPVRTTTAADGRFRFVRLAFGRYTITATAGDRSGSTTVDVASDTSGSLVLALGTATIGATRAPASASAIGGSAVALTAAELNAAPQAHSLDRLLETLPGIVRFSYDEPVAHGFHGVAYEIDGAPIPQTTSASFSEIVDPRSIDSLEVFTGAFPAEFGGERQGALVNIITKRVADIPNGSQTALVSGIGTYGAAETFFANATRIGATDIFLNANLAQTARGLDTPSLAIVHDASSQSDQFLRTVTRLGPGDTLAFDYANQYDTYQVPINPTATPVDSIVNLLTQDDTQREYSRFASLNYTHVSPDGAFSWQAIPWWRSSRIVYAGDLAADVQAQDQSADDCAPNAPPCALAGLSQDRYATVAGLRLNAVHIAPRHTIKAGVDGSVENFTSSETILAAGSAPFFDNVAQRGTAFAAYLQDAWTPNASLTVNAGLRWDVSSGFTGGSSIQPRLGAHLRIAPQTTFHAYYGRLYAAPALEDTRRDAVVVGGGDPDALPVYDLKPQTESYYEAGFEQRLPGDVIASLTGWQRNVWNVLDTTQIYPTPIFATYNNALGLAHGLELRIAQNARVRDWYLSAAFSQSVAGGISGGTFLFPPDALADSSLQPEDHDQAFAANGAYTQRFGRRLRWYATVGSEYGTGYPVAFQNGNGRLTPHLTFDAALGVRPERASPGFRITALNLGDYRYLIKVNNGFNTTQYAPGLQLLAEGQLAF